MLNALHALIGASHDHNVLTLVRLHLPTMSNKVRDLFDVDIVGLEHAGDVTLAPSEALHQWSDAIVVLTVDVCRKFSGTVFLRPRTKLPKLTVRMLSASFDV